MTDETQSRARSRSLRRPPSAARLTVVFPPDRFATHDLTGRSVVVGRESEVAIAEPSVSREHLSIEWDAARQAHLARDRNSRHGTTLNGTALDDESFVPLANNAVLRLADVVAVYECGERHDDVPETAALPGTSFAMNRLRARVARAAPDRSPALIIGDTGTGKESIAAELHRQSGRGGPFVPVNCAAIPTHLVESQLFGHTRGAFTGADSANPGLIRSATGGTLFLDEVGELALELQPKLLRALQEREVTPVGASTPVRVDVRVIAATNRNLREAVEQSTFRRDLYARLALWDLHVPPLSERRADVVGWVERLMARWSAERGKNVSGFPLDAEAVELLLLAEFPENLRAIDRLVHELSVTGVTPPDGLPAWLLEASPNPPTNPPLDAPRAPTGRRPAPSKEELVEVLDRLGSVRAAARHFARDRRQIYRWIDQYELVWRDRSDPQGQGS